MYNDLVSIIIPIYNVEDYLERCLDSVCRQSYINIEILLLNDGSSDGSYDICKKWEKKDNRIRLYTDVNKGVSAVRNVGLQHSKGEYIIFVDSDDVVSENYVEILVKTIKDVDVDLAIVSFCSFSEDSEPFFSNKESTSLIKDEVECCFFEITEGMIWGKIYKNEIIQNNNIRFDERIAVTEDLLFNFYYARYCEKIAYNRSVLYGYFQRYNSAVHNNISIKWFTCLNVYKYLFEAYKNKKVFSYIVYFYLKNLYESIYLLKKKVKDLVIDINVAEEIKKAEKQRCVLTFCQKIRLFFCKYFMSFVLLKRERRSRRK